MSELTPKQKERAEELALQSYSKENVFQYASFTEGYASAIKDAQVLVEALDKIAAYDSKHSRQLADETIKKWLDE